MPLSQESGDLLNRLCHHLVAHGRGQDGMDVRNANQLFLGRGVRHENNIILILPLVDCPSVSKPTTLKGMFFI
jgi:hypothetical protein